MMRALVVGNWKMNTDAATGVALATAIVEGAGSIKSARMAVCPPFPFLASVARITQGTPVGLGAQNAHEADAGAYTGEVAAAMLQGIAEYVILGHSERRELFGETSAGVARKCAAVAKLGMTAIVCVGESLQVHDDGRAAEFVESQVRASLDGFADWKRLVIAYEPIWAIGSGRTPETAEIGAMCRHIAQVAGAMQPPGSDPVQVLYGGSVNPTNAGAIYAEDGVGGFLVGGSSLDAHKFLAIASSVDN